MMCLRHACWAVLAFLASANLAFADQRFRVSVVSANVRFEPSITSAIIARVGRGTVLRVVAIEGTWVKVALPDSGGLEKVGYIASTRGTYVFPVFFGKWLDGYYSAVSFGGGIGRRLSERVELLADVAYGKYSDGYESAGFIQESSSFLLVSGNIVYNFSPFAERFTPFTGGGLLWVRSVDGGSVQTRPFPFRFRGSTETFVTAQALVRWRPVPIQESLGHSRRGSIPFLR